MDIPKNYFDLILKEFKDVQELCTNAETPDDAVYYFSALHGVLNRVMNFCCIPILIFMHQVLQATHQAISNRQSMTIKPGVTSNGVTDEMWEALFSYIPLLISAFEKKDEDEIRRILEKFSNLSYATTGNGRYLQLRGRLKLDV